MDGLRPCADHILNNGIKKVVIGAVDTNEEVGGKGIKKLRDNGVEVMVSVLEKECLELNKRFYTFHEKKRPYVILKWAQSIDGFIFPDKEEVQKGTPFWISNPYARQRVHQYRAEEAAILVGKNTVIQDDPQLSVRGFAGNQILRIAIDRRLEADSSSKIYDGSSPSIIYNGLKDMAEGEVNFVKLDFERDIIPQIMMDLHKRNVQSLIVEGGTVTLNAFIQSEVWDEAKVFSGTQKFINGIKAPELDANLEREEFIDNNILRVYKPKL